MTDPEQESIGALVFIPVLLAFMAAGRICYGIWEIAHFLSTAAVNVALIRS